MREFSGKDLTISQSTKAVLATLDWTAALVLLSAVTLGGLPLVFAAWSVICALWGTTFLVWALMVRERLSLERLADIMAAHMDGDGDKLRAVR